MPRAIAKTVVLYASLLWAVHAQAQSSSDRVRGTVVRIDEGDVIVDVGSDRIDEGRELQVYRRIRVRHPITKESLEDRFVIGKLRITQAGETLSLARTVEPPDRPIQPGDAVETERQRAQATSEPAPSDDTGEEQATARSAAERDLLDAWRRTLARPPKERISIYLRYLKAHPDGPHAESVKREVAALRQLAEAPGGFQAAAERSDRGAQALRNAVRIDPIHATREGRATEIAATTNPDGPVRALIVYARPAGGSSYQRLPMEIDASGHARVTLPEALVAPPELELFVVAAGPRGIWTPVLGTGTRPATIEVAPAEPPSPPADRNRARVRFSTEYASFNGTEGNDWLVIAQGDFLLRTELGPLYGVRVGYGHFRGEGGDLAVLDAGGAPEPAVFTYGFLELELRLHPLFAVMVRTTAGLGQLEQRDPDASGLRGGFQLRLRIGPERGTNLVLAGETIPEIGQRAFIGLRWEVLEDWPMGAEVHVTDQPVNSGDLGVRGVFEAGHRFGDVATVSARVSFQGRRIDHSGFGGGLAATFDF